MKALIDVVPDLDRCHETPSRYVWIRIKRASDQKHACAIGHVDCAGNQRCVSDYVAKTSHLFGRNLCGLSRVERKRSDADVASGKHGSRRSIERQEVDLPGNQPDTRV